MIEVPPAKRGAQHKLESKRLKQEVYLAEVRKARDEDSTREAAGIGPTTLPKWRYYNEGHDDFRLREQEARAAGAQHLEGRFPSFLTFRESHFAYFDHRRGIHPRTGRKWAIAATNSFYQNDAVAQLASSNQLIMIMPPGHIKTTLFGIEMAVYDVMKDRDVRLLTISRSQEEAKKVVAAVQLRLSDHSYYHDFAELLEAQGDMPITCPLCAYEGTVPFRPQGRSREASVSPSTPNDEVRARFPAWQHGRQRFR